MGTIGEAEKEGCLMAARRCGGLGLALLAGIGAFAAGGPAGADPWGARGHGSLVADSPTHLGTGADGVYGAMETAGDMTAIVNCGGDYRAELYIPGGCVGQGANLRPIGVDSYDSAAPNEFVATGYGVGCVGGAENAGEHCSLVNTSLNKWYKKWYVDGRTTQTSAGDFYFQTWQGAISAGSHHSYQIQRRNVSGAYRWLIWFNGSGPNGAPVTVNNMTFRYGSSYSGAENASGILHPSPAVNQQLPRFYDWWQHVYGTTSANPPGKQYLTQVKSPNEGEEEPHSPNCTIAWDYTLFHLTGGGNC